VGSSVPPESPPMKSGGGKDLQVVEIQNGKYKIHIEDVIKILKTFKEVEEIELYEINEAIEFLIKENILFVDPALGVVKPQSKLDLLALRKVLELI
jgi:hypothetical protein